MNKYDITNYVYQKNELVTQEWKMDRVTLKLFEMAVSAIDTLAEDPSCDVVLNKNDVFALFKANDRDKYYRFEQHIDRLLKQVVDMPLSNNRIGSIVPITYFEWGKDSDDQHVLLRFNQLIMPFIQSMTGYFTRYKISHLIDLSSKYSILIYKLIKMEYWGNHKKRGAVRLKVEELRKITGTKEIYPLWSDFEKRVLKIAKDEINNGQTDVVMTYRKIKNGRKIDIVEFLVRDKLSYSDNKYHVPKPITDEDVTVSFDDTDWEVN